MKIRLVSRRAAVSLKSKCPFINGFLSFSSQVCKCDKQTTYEEVEKCNDEFTNACPEKWEIIEGAKVWVPDTSKCTNLKLTKCEYETVKKEDGETKCEQKMEKSCKCVHERIPKQKETNVAYKKCGNKRPERLTNAELTDFGLDAPKKY